MHSRHLQELLVNKLERIDALLELNVLIGQLGLVFGCAQLLLDHLLGTLRKRREARTVRQKTTKQEDVSKATGRGFGPWDRGFRVCRWTHLKFFPNACTRSMIGGFEDLTREKKKEG